MTDAESAVGSYKTVGPSAPTDCDEDGLIQ